jgi:hypothetical protein
VWINCKKGDIVVFHTCIYCTLIRLTPSSALFLLPPILQQLSVGCLVLPSYIDICAFLHCPLLHHFLSLSLFLFPQKVIYTYVCVYICTYMLYIDFSVEKFEIVTVINWSIDPACIRHLLYTSFSFRLWRK